MTRLLFKAEQFYPVLLELRKIINYGDEDNDYTHYEPVDTYTGGGNLSFYTTGGHIGNTIRQHIANDPDSFPTDDHKLSFAQALVDQIRDEPDYMKLLPGLEDTWDIDVAAMIFPEQHGIHGIDIDPDVMDPQERYHSTGQLDYDIKDPKYPLGKRPDIQNMLGLNKARKNLPKKEQKRRERTALKRQQQRQTAARQRDVEREVTRRKKLSGEAEREGSIEGYKDQYQQEREARPIPEPTESVTPVAERLEGHRKFLQDMENEKREATSRGQTSIRPSEEQLASIPEAMKGKVRDRAIAHMQRRANKEANRMARIEQRGEPTGIKRYITNREADWKTLQDYKERAKPKQLHDLQFQPSLNTQTPTAPVDPSRNMQGDLPPFLQGRAKPSVQTPVPKVTPKTATQTIIGKLAKASPHYGGSDLGTMERTKPNELKKKKSMEYMIKQAFGVATPRGAKSSHRQSQASHSRYQGRFPGMQGAKTHKERLARNKQMRHLQRNPNAQRQQGIQNKKFQQRQGGSITGGNYQQR